MLTDRDLRAALVALQIAGVDAREQERIASTVIFSRLDRQQATMRRNLAILEAAAIMGTENIVNISALAASLKEYELRTFPLRRHLVDPPETDKPLHQCFFKICQASADAGKRIPVYETILRVIKGE